MDEDTDAAIYGGRYPSEWPVCCPPRDAVEVEATMYRAVEGRALTDSDFLNAVEAGKFLKENPCARLAISLNRTLDGVKRSFILFPYRAAWHVATVTLGRHHGRVSNAPTRKQLDHVSWWPYTGVLRHETVVEVNKP